MATLKGQFKDLEVSDDGSQVKIRLVNGDVLSLAAPDLLALMERLLDGAIAAQCRELDPDLPNRFASVPEVIKPTDLNPLFDHTGNAFSLEVKFGQGRRLVLHLTETQRDRLASILDQKAGSGPTRH